MLLVRSDYVLMIYGHHYNIHFVVNCISLIGSIVFTGNQSIYFHRVGRIASRHRTVVQVRAFADGSDSKLPFGIDKLVGETADNLIPTDRDRKSKKGSVPDFVPPEVKKDLEELGLDSIEDLDEMEEKNLDGYNELGLVPPEGSGTFDSPILIPSRYDSRAVGYEDPETHAMYWFNIQNDNNTYYIKDLGLFFKMLHIYDEEVEAEKHHH